MPTSAGNRWLIVGLIVATVTAVAGWLVAAVAVGLLVGWRDEPPVTPRPLPMPIETAPGGPPVQPGDPNDAGGLELAPGPDDTAAAQAGCADIDGMDLAGAEQYALDHGLGIRVGSLDGDRQAVTMDYSPTRMTVDLVDGLVVGCTVG